ncbi:IclR family transcriptional regulator [Leucobacter ruminantium]|uniref:Helix-turn-helix domain-containing protein n=1 Tax=Leucobacter ruminantium TaxID=1289170 RepID=A0A939S063_9MICO|nr:IclR family transcriptional regulator C-terminal domain-containing protein [Leucobacter ruminantium]MBO1806556.1 helix-turn-helix domain-containing protein [Leucobacter ruminantium]
MSERQYHSGMRSCAQELEAPAYALGSVDKTLRVIHILRDGNPIRVSTVARDLGIGVSTAHRIMAMLVFHGFAVQGSKRQYLPGPALGAPVLMAKDVDQLRQAAGPIIEQLAATVGETVNLTLRVGPHARVLLAVGTNGRTEFDRSGAVLPAYATAAGRASLTGVSQEQLEHLFRGPAAERASTELDEEAFAELERELNRTRIRGFAISLESAVKGVSAVALPVASAKTRTITIAVLTPSEAIEDLIHDEARMGAIREAAQLLGERLEVED